MCFSKELSFSISKDLGNFLFPLQGGCVGHHCHGDEATGGSSGGTASIAVAHRSTAVGRPSTGWEVLQMGKFGGCCVAKIVEMMVYVSRYIHN